MRADQDTVGVVEVYTDDFGLPGSGAVDEVLGANEAVLGVIDDLLNDAVGTIELVGAFLENNSCGVIVNAGHGLEAFIEFIDDFVSWLAALIVESFDGLTLVRVYLFGTTGAVWKFAVGDFFRRCGEGKGAESEQDDDGFPAVTWLNCRS